LIDANGAPWQAGTVPGLDPTDLFEVVATPTPDDRELVLIEALDGFVDAGSAKRGLREHLLGTLESTVLASFDVDVFHDYRARRPAMVFDSDHWESYDAPTLEIRQVLDTTGRPFLVLAGSEPDVLWERFVAGVIRCVERFDACLGIGLTAIPMGVPHTRPPGMTAHGNRADVLAAYPPWLTTVTVPASAGHLLEHRLSGSGRGALGFAVHVPHYLAQTAYPIASLGLLHAIENATGLQLGGEALETAAVEARETIDGLVSQSDELGELVNGLETQYDAYVSARGQSLLAGEGAIPTGDELGAELERFLAEQSRHGDDPRPT
jgi:hypothetical protein